MREARCECCDLPAYSCGRVIEDQQRREQRVELERLLAHPAWFVADYPGTCAGCGEDFKPGTPISRVSAGWRAQCCAEVPLSG